MFGKPTAEVRFGLDAHLYVCTYVQRRASIRWQLSNHNVGAAKSDGKKLEQQTATAETTRSYQLGVALPLQNGSKSYLFTTAHLQIHKANILA